MLDKVTGSKTQTTLTFFLVPSTFFWVSTWGVGGRAVQYTSPIIIALQFVFINNHFELEDICIPIFFALADKLRPYFIFA